VGKERGVHLCAAPHIEKGGPGPDRWVAAVGNDLKLTDVSGTGPACGTTEQSIQTRELRHVGGRWQVGSGYSANDGQNKSNQFK
jgi:hypothetical protein